MPKPVFGKAGFEKLKSKGSKQRTLPDRGGMNDLAKGGRTLTDYAKATPMDDATPSALTTMFMGKR